LNLISNSIPFLVVKKTKIRKKSFFESDYLPTLLPANASPRSSGGCACVPCCGSWPSTTPPTRRRVCTSPSRRSATPTPSPKRTRTRIRIQNSPLPLTASIAASKHPCSPIRTLESVSVFAFSVVLAPHPIRLMVLTTIRRRGP